MAPSITMSREYRDGIVRGVVYMGDPTPRCNKIENWHLWELYAMLGRCAQRGLNRGK